MLMVRKAKKGRGTFKCALYYKVYNTGIEVYDIDRTICGLHVRVKRMVGLGYVWRQFFGAICHRLLRFPLSIIT